MAPASSSIDLSLNDHGLSNIHCIYMQTLHGIDNVSVHSIHDREAISFSPIHELRGFGTGARVDRLALLLFSCSCFWLLVSRFLGFLLSYFYGTPCYQQGQPGLISFFDTLFFGCYFTKRDAFCWRGLGVRYYGIGMGLYHASHHHHHYIGWLLSFSVLVFDLLHHTAPAVASHCITHGMAWQTRPGQQQASK